VLWSAPATAGAIAAGFALVSAVSGTPLASGVAAAALVVAASMMTPVPPLDGSHLRSRAASWAVTAVLTLGSAALILHWI
jgi:Zn-dependent protease